MSLTTKPPAGDSANRAESSPPGAVRLPGARAMPADVGAALKLLGEEIAAAVRAIRGAGAAEAPPTVGDDPRQAASTLLAWLGQAARGGAIPAAELAAAVERATVRALAILARRPGDGGSAEEVARVSRELTIALQAAPSPPDGRTRATGSPALRILVEELRSALAATLGEIEPPPLPVAGEEPGNVAAALVRWVRVVAAAAGVPIGTLRAATDAALERTRAALGADPAEAQGREALAQARDVLIAAVGRAPRPSPADAPPAFRPDLPVPAGALRATRPRVRPEPGRARLAEPRTGEPADEREAEDDGAPALADLRGPMELIRRYVEDFYGDSAATCARHFVFPACMWVGRRWHAHADSAALGAFYQAYRHDLLARGTVRGRVLMARVEPVGDAVAIVHARIARESAVGAVLEEIEVAYTTVHTPKGWRIAVVMLD
jgi:hypothetical protein